MTTLYRSNAYQEMYPDDKMLRAFGSLTPSASERNAYFFDLWCARRANRIDFDMKDKHKAKSILKQMGLKEMWDYQIRENSIRFEETQDVAMFKIAWNKDG